VCASGKFESIGGGDTHFDATKEMSNINALYLPSHSAEAPLIDSVRRKIDKAVQQSIDTMRRKIDKKHYSS
jgi:hypothetical protein